ncbi:MAG: hypothetical protein ACKOFD_00720, partial [Actinomycetota bacterium]
MSVTVRADVLGSIDSGVHEFFIGHRPSWLVDISKFLDTYGSSEMLLGVAIIVGLMWLVRARPSLLPLAI